MTISIPCSLGNGYCTFGFLIFIIDKRNFLYYSLYILTEKSLKHLCSIRAWVSVSIFLSFSLSLSPRLIPWSAETRLAHSLAWASKTLSKTHPVPSPHLERASADFVRDKSCAKDFIVFCCKPGSISLFLPFTFLSSPLDLQVPAH